MYLSFEDHLVSERGLIKSKTIFLYLLVSSEVTAFNSAENGYALCFRLPCISWWQL